MECSWHEVGGERCGATATYWAETQCECGDDYLPGRGAVCARHAAVARAGASRCSDGGSVRAISVQTLDLEMAE